MSPKLLLTANRRTMDMKIAQTKFGRLAEPSLHRQMSLERRRMRLAVATIKSHLNIVYTLVHSSLGQIRFRNQASIFAIATIAMQFESVSSRSLLCFKR